MRALGTWSEVEYAWGNSGRSGSLWDLDARALLVFISGHFLDGMPDEASRQRLRDMLARSDAEASSAVPDDYGDVDGIPEGWRPEVDVAVPDWWDGGGFKGKNLSIPDGGRVA